MMPEISLHILDMGENSGRAGATSLLIEVRADEEHDTLLVRMLDNGPGLGEPKSDDPFFTSKEGKRFGLGIPMMGQAAEAAGGSMEIGPGPEGGTEVRAEFVLGHMDRMPLGDIGGTVAAIVAGYPDMDVELVLASKAGEYRFTTKALREELEGLALNTPQVLEYIKQEIQEASRRHDV